MKVKDFKAMVLERFRDEDDECEIIVPVNGNPMEIVGIKDHGSFYTKPGGLPFELEIK